MTSQPPPGPNPYQPQGPYQPQPQGPYQPPQGPYQPQGPYPAQGPYQSQAPNQQQTPYPAGPPQVNQPGPSGPPYPSPYQNPANLPQSPAPGPGPVKRPHKKRGLVVAAVIVVAAGGVVAFLASNHKSNSGHATSRPNALGAIAVPKVSPNGATSSATAPVGGASAATGGGSVVSPTTSPSTAPPPPATGGTGSALPVEANGWRLDGTNFKSDVLGNFTGTATLTYTGTGVPTTDLTIFQITLFVDGKHVADLLAGPVGGLTGGRTTLDILSADPLVPGPYTYTMTVDSQ